MFGLSFAKILLLVIVVAAVWFGYRWLELARRERLAGRRSGSIGGRRDRHADVVDLERNPKTGAYEPRRPDERG